MHNSYMQTLIIHFLSSLTNKTDKHNFFFFAYLLSTKPQVAKAVLSAAGIRDGLAGKLLVSICAGVTIEQLKSWTTPTTTIIRAMPNTPCKVFQNASFLFFVVVELISWFDFYHDQ